MSDIAFQQLFFELWQPNEKELLEQIYIRLPMIVFPIKVHSVGVQEPWYIAPEPHVEIVPQSGFHTPAEGPVLNPFLIHLTNDLRGSQTDVSRPADK
jgi:hypothetical protein